MEKDVRKISEHYSKENQVEKAKEELSELYCELTGEMEINGKMVLPENTWSECADVIIMVMQLAMQHGKEYKVMEQMDYKIRRQLGRMKDESLRES